MGQTVALLNRERMERPFHSTCKKEVTKKFIIQVSEKNLKLDNIVENLSKNNRLGHGRSKI